MNENKYKYTEEQIDEQITALLTSDFQTKVSQNSVLPVSQGGKGYGGKDLISVLAQEASNNYDLTDSNTKLPVLEFPSKVRVNGKAAWLEYDSQKGKWDYVYHDQDIAKVADQCTGNCFVYGTDTEQLIAKGKGYTSTITENNGIFEATDLGWGVVRKYNIQISPGSSDNTQDGYVQLKTEPYEKLLALKTIVKGQAEIQDGKWAMSFDGNKAYAQTITSTETPDGADMRVFYNNQEYMLIFLV